MVQWIIKGMWQTLELRIALGQYQAIPWWQQAICLVYGWGATLHKAAYRWLPVTQLPVPVISVGNLTVGGTGKTPVTIAIAQYLVSQGKHVLVLSRGYRAEKNYVPGEPLTPEHGDEPFCIQQAVPQATVRVGRDRVALAKRALCHNPTIDVILLDDGHQYYKLHKTLDIVLLDAERGLGNTHCLPFGPLRAPVNLVTAPENQVAVWVHKTPTVYDRPVLRLKWPHQTNLYCNTHLCTPDQSPVPPGPVVLATGIANPTPLVQWLQANGYPVIQHIAFVDHKAYTAADWQKIAASVQAHQAWLVTTQKDWVKFTDLPRQLNQIGIANTFAQLDETLIDWLNACFL
jgi:tetraacyldisaccharide 4'-kinase